MLRYSWIQADSVALDQTGQTAAELTNQTTAELIHSAALKYFPSALKVLPPQQIHSTLVYIGSEVDDNLRECVKGMSLGHMKFKCEILKPPQGDTNKKVIMLGIHSDQFSETFNMVWNLLESYQIHPEHTKQDQTKYKYGFSAHLTLAEFETEEQAELAINDFDFEQFFELLGHPKYIMVKDFHLYGDNPEGQSVKVEL